MKREGITLTEVLLAMALMGGVLVAVIGAINDNSRRAHANAERAATRLVLGELLELVTAEPADRLHALCTGHPGPLADLLARRIERLPASIRAPYQEQVRDIAPTLSATLEDGAGGQPGLALVVLSATVNSSVIEVKRLIRPEP